MTETTISEGLNETLLEKLQQTPGVTLRSTTNTEDEGIYITVCGDWNDGDEITETSLVDIDESSSIEEIQEILKEINWTSGGSYSPSGKPDGAEYHDLEIEELYLIDHNGNKYDLSYDE